MYGYTGKFTLSPEKSKGRGMGLIWKETETEKPKEEYDKSPFVEDVS
jgi:hypothetical protein